MALHTEAHGLRLYCDTLFAPGGHEDESKYIYMIVVSQVRQDFYLTASASQEINLPPLRKMVRKLFGIIASISLLFNGALATPTAVCSTGQSYESHVELDSFLTLLLGICKALVPLLSNDPAVQRFCATLPASSKFNRSKCPKLLQPLAYTAIKTLCGCLCRSPNTQCLDGCFNLQTGSQQCGSCTTSVQLPFI